MSLNPAAPNRTPSPISSVRTSPLPRRRVDEDPTKKDPKYKRFAQTIDRALSLFESNNLQEWADYISFLSRLLKALQSHPSLPLIPRKFEIAKRLAQCLHPSRPSGVHQKTIEVYSYIFSLIGRDGLAADLALWTPGLAPVLGYASLTLKPHFLDLVDRFYIPLGTALRPALKSILLSLLPGIDEEGGEYFERTMQLLDAVRTGVEDEAYFWQCMMLATITAPGRRQGALAWLARRLPSFVNEEVGGEVEALVEPEPGLLVRALMAGLGDTQLLVQRGFLDLLVERVPLSCAVLQERVRKEDLKMLVTAAAGVVGRKDMGLNRRLWRWYTGPEDGNTLEYFEKSGAKWMVEGLLEMFVVSEDAGSVARPFRVCLSLMDCWEIGSTIAPKVFFPAVETLRQYEQVAAAEKYAEVLKSANTFFDGIEASLIWGQITEKLASAFGKEPKDSLEALLAVRFIIQTFNVREEEMIIVHAPLLVLEIILRLQKVPMPDPEFANNAALLAMEVWNLVPETALKKQPSSEDITADGALEQISAFYTKSQTAGNSGKATAPPAVLGNVSEFALSTTAEFVRGALTAPKVDIDTYFRLFLAVLQKTPQPVDCSSISALATSFLSKLQNEQSMQFPALQGIAHAVALLHMKGYLQEQQTDHLVFMLVKALWNYLSPDTPKYPIEAIRALWTLQSVLGDRRIEAAVSTVMATQDLAGTYSVRTAEQGRRFAVLWMHSVYGPGGHNYHVVLTRPLFLFLDSLADDAVEMSVFARGWLQNLTSINKLFWIFVAKLLDCDFLNDPGQRDEKGAPKTRPVYAEDDSIEIAIYYFQTLLNVLRYATNNVLATLAGELVVGSDENRARALQQKGYGDEDMTLQTFFAKAALRAVDGDAADPETAKRVSKLHKMALGVLHQLLLSPFSKPLAELQLEDSIMVRLISIMDTTETYVQVSLLDVLHVSLKLSLTRHTAPPVRQRVSNSSEVEKPPLPPVQSSQPLQQLLECLIRGFSKKSARPVLDSWIFFLSECLPLIEHDIFQFLMPLVGCLCEQIKISFDALKRIFVTGAENTYEREGRSPESTLLALLNGLEQILATGHERLLLEESKTSSAKAADVQASSGFFGNMVSGVWNMQHSQSTAENNRLTVVLCFRDTVKVCHAIWSWGDSNLGSTGVLDAASQESWAYTSLRMKGRARKILEHMFAAETLESLETLIEIWPGRMVPLAERKTEASIFKLVNALDGSRPKHTVPAIFNAIYTRTNPGALEPGRQSTKTAELTDMDVVVFLVEYAQSLEEDAMDEIWSDCIVFLKDVLTNPFPHRQTLPSLLGFTAILGEKVDNTNFGEQKRMRKELGDLFLRVLTAVFTVTPQNRSIEGPSDNSNAQQTTKTRTNAVPDDIVDILVLVVPNLRSILRDSSLIFQATTTITTSLIIPAFRSKSFPRNITPSLLTLLHHLTRLPNTQKAWRTPLSDAFLDSKFFSSDTSLVTSHWIPLYKQYLSSDRDRLTTLLSALTPPNTPNILFTLTAASARAEADKKTSLALKRIAFLLLSADPDSFVPGYPDLEEKLAELLNATAVSYPSAAVKADIFLLLRVLLLCTSPVHLSSLWPLINAELQAAFTSLFPEAETKDAFDTRAVLGSCKLLDLLLVLQIDEWQLSEWLFVTDTVDAVFGDKAEKMAVCDVVGECVGGGEGKGGHGVWFTGEREGEEDVGAFLKSVSLRAYEGVFGGRGEGGRDSRAVLEREVVRELFEEEA